MIRVTSVFQNKSWIGHNRLMKRWIARMLFVVILAVAVQGIAATQQISGHPIMISVADSGAPAVGVETAANAGTGTYTTQYYNSLIGGIASWSSHIWLSGTNALYHYGMNSTTGTNLTLVSNTLTTSGSTSTITTVVDLGSSGVRATQKIIYTDGNRFITKEWTLVNNGTTTFSDLRFFHGGDSYFGGVDSAYAFYEPSNSMVYLRNNDFANWGIMGFYADPATPANYYFGGQFNTGTGAAGSGAHLSNTVDTTYTDAGYQLEWTRATFSPGETWLIRSYEQWTPGGALQVIAPAGQSVTAASTVDLSFTVQNLGASSVSASFSASDSSGWGTSITSSSPVTIAANGSTNVTVRTAVPVGATPGQTTNVTMTATDGVTPKSASATLSVISVDFTISPTPVAFGTVSVGGSGSQTVTITNTGSVSMQLGTLGGTNPLAAPFSKSSDTCSGANIAASGTCTFAVNYNPTGSSTFSDSINIPVSSPVVLSQTLAVSGTAPLPNYTVGTSIIGNGSASPVSQSVANGSAASITFNATTPGNHLVSIDTGCNGTGYSPGYTTGTSGVTSYSYTAGANSSNCTVGATFSTNQYNVTAAPSANGTITGGASGATVTRTTNYGAAQTFTYNANAGYHLTQIGNGCGGSVQNFTYSNGDVGAVSASYTSSGATADCTTTATTAINKYNVTATPDTNSKVDSYALNTPHAYSGIDYNASQSVTFTADTGYHLSGINNSCGGTASAAYYNGNNGPWISTATFTTSGTTGQVTAGVAPNCGITASSAINVYSITPGVNTVGP
jgi:hypothetical protein